MSLVGTRPPTIDEWEKYEPHHRARMSFRPGLTGLWQVSGRSNITDFEEVVKLDTKACLEAIPKEPAEQSVVPVPAELMTMEIPADATQIQSRQSVSASLEIKVNDITLCVTELTSSELLTKVLQVIRDVK